MQRRSFSLAGASTIGTALLPHTSILAADEWPSRPVRIVHGFSSGLIDEYARLIAQQFKDFFGQPAFVEQKVGAGGTVAANFVSKSAPDGHTLLLMPSGFAAAPGLYRTLPYDPVRDFTVISMLTRNAVGFVAPAAGSIGSIQELVRQARAGPRAVDLGMPGVGTGPHLGAVLFQAAAGITMTSVPYKGESFMLNALMAGEVPVIVTSVAGIGALLGAGKIKLLAVTSRDRSPVFPDTPSVSETVVPGFDFVGWSAFAGPRGLNSTIVGRLNAMVRDMLLNTQIVTAMRTRGTTLWATEPRQAQDFVAGEITRWSQAARDAKITPEG